jgi:hypothetical protein
MATFTIFRETSLPSELAASAVYLIAPSADSALLEIVATTAAGDAARHVINKADVQDLIDASMANAGASDLLVVDDISARDALSPAGNVFVQVIDATGDSTVKAGGARYLYRKSTNEWIKTSEDESMDVTFTWAKIQGGPSSSPNAIDDAVNKAHTHANKTELDEIGENAAGELTYAGKQVKLEYSATAW